MKIIAHFSPNFNEKKRPIDSIKILVIHYTGMQSERESIIRLSDPKFEVSSHFVISQNGKIYRLVQDNKIAWHAGKSCWGKYRNLNKNSIGIELVNKGHQFGYTYFKKKQISSLIRLCKNLIKKYKIKIIVGHSDIAPLRKKDPGEKFPWNKLYKNNIGIWYKKSKFKSKDRDENKLEKLFFKNLFRIGYRYFSKKRRSKNDIFLIKAFQRRFLLSNVTGKIDQKTYKISYFLAKRVKN